jgi:alanine racemase
MPRAVAEVNLAAIERNVARLLRGLAPGTQLCAVVKADGYGHGARRAARAALDGGASMLAVASAGEAAELRDGGVRAPLLVLGALSEAELAVAVTAGAQVTAWHESFVDRVAALAHSAGRPVGVHVKLDTGLGRLGTRDLTQALGVAATVSDTTELQLVGAMTHFATADGDPEFVTEQLSAFQPFVQGVRSLPGGDRVIVHAANSGAILRFPDSHFDMVRAGISVYGGDPMNQDPTTHGLEPALALRSYVAAVKPTGPGDSAGYGRRFVASRGTYLATLPIGYGDGVVRALADNCDVLIRGARYPLVGMVSMDNITVDLGPEPAVRVGDIATLIGVDGDQRQTAEDIAKRVGTINYEVFCWISKRVPRVYHRDGVPA